MSTIEILTEEECSLLLSRLSHLWGPHKKQRRGVRDYCMALLMLDAGLRISEVCNLAKTDLFYQNMPVTSIIIRAEIAKKKRERKIPISERLCTAIKAVERVLWSHNNDYSTAYAFYVTEESAPISIRQVRRIIHEAGMKALHRDIHPHMLRHTFATRLMQKTNIRVVQELLGHQSLTSTQIYTHPNDQDLKSAIEGIAPGKEGVK